MKLYLASKSPRRKQLLEQIGVDYKTIDIDIDEAWDGQELAKTYVQRMACEKARCAGQKITDDSVVIAADTSVVLDNRILGKATSRAAAREMLEQLSGRTHEVMTAVTVLNRQERSVLNISKVAFRNLSGDDINHYCATDEPIGKAGAYAIQGRAAAFISHLEGSYSGVMGLPLYETCRLLRSAGISVV
ncbi:MAG: Maf family nucleotide pyrophosphatase [Thiotrichales bacterium]|nr:Maf family nucleotide pyrophosphatase [Thiotrichales bacterium]